MTINTANDIIIFTKNVFDKGGLRVFENKKEINIVFLGGSITQGAGSSDKSKCFANMTGEWFKEKYGADRVNYYNKGVGGTPSFYGLLRLQRDVIAYNPDMVFVEFAVNDTGSDSRVYLESIVRMLGNIPSNPYIVFLYTTNKDYTTPTQNFEQVANYYGIPQISLKDALKRELNGEDAFEAGYLADSVHPSDKGYEVYYNEMIRLLEKEEYYKKPIKKEKTLVEGCFAADTRFISSTEVLHTDGWKVTTIGERKSLLAEKENESIEFEFDGNILGFEHGLHQDSGVYNVYVDDKLIGTGSPYYSNNESNQLVFGFVTTDLDDGHHKVKVETAKGEHGGTRILLYNIIIGNKN